MTKSKRRSEQPGRALSSGDASNLESHRVYYLEYLQCVGVFFCLFVCLSTASFNPLDTSPFSVSSRAASEVSNLFGSVGAVFADISIQFFGVGSLFFGWIFLAHALCAFQKKQVSSRWQMRLLGYPQLIVSFLAIMSSFHPHWRVSEFQIASGGVVGSEVNALCASLFGKTGSRLVLFFGVLASFPLCLGIRPLYLCRHLIPKKWSEIIREELTIQLKISEESLVPKETTPVKETESPMRQTETLQDVDVFYVERGVPQKTHALGESFGFREKHFEKYISLLELPQKSIVENET